MKETLITLAYLVAASLFIVGLKRLSSPLTARAGNQLAAGGMLVAVVATLFLEPILSPIEMVAGLVLGGAIGVWLARSVEMTGMPELVAAFNGFGGAASALVAAAEVARFAEVDLPGIASLQVVPAEVVAPISGVSALTIALSVLIGTVTFSGSFVAFGKLSGRISGNPTAFPGMRLISIAVALGVVAATVWIVVGAADFPAVQDPVVWGLAALAVLALVLGVLLVVPIGGGGLISGVATAVKALRPEVEIIGVEAALYPSMQQALGDGGSGGAGRDGSRRRGRRGANRGRRRGSIGRGGRTINPRLRRASQIDGSTTRCYLMRIPNAHGQAVFSIDEPIPCRNRKVASRRKSRR